jgi:hypothetical protein
MSGTLDRKFEYGLGSIWWIYTERAAGLDDPPEALESSVN